MTQLLENQAQPLYGVLARLRRQVRRYVWIEGLAATLAAAVLAFWLLFGVDWLFEPFKTWRVIILLLAMAAVAVVLYRRALARAAVRLTDANMAVLLERRFPQLDDGLLTSVDLAETGGLPEPTRQMLAHTRQEAEHRVQQIDVREVFDLAPLLRMVTLATVLCLTVVVLALASPETLKFGFRRIVGLTDEMWPRRSRLVVEGFENGEAVIGRGADLPLVVLADTAAEEVPDSVQIRYRTDEGSRGRETMTREGTAEPGRDPFQKFTHTFQNVLAPLAFDVRGGDARLRDLKVRVVDNPALVEPTLLCQYPDYIDRAETELRVTGAMQLPVGTRVTLRSQSNKDLRRVEIQYGSGTDETLDHAIDLADGAREFEFALGALERDTTLAIVLFDTDGVRNQQPFLISLAAVPDEPPTVSVELKNISSAVTPEARLPVTGEITDDWGLAKAAFRYQFDEADAQEQPFAAQPSQTGEMTVDEAFDLSTLDAPPKPGQKLIFGALAVDTFQLRPEDTPHTTTSELYQLDVVTADQLRSILESRELNLRQRFETIIDEVAQTRDSLARLEEGTAEETGEETGDGSLPSTALRPGETGAEEAADTPEDEDADASASEPREKLRVERAKQNASKNAEETLGVATAFDDICEEMINNRIDTEELRLRLRGQIAEPLGDIGERMFAELDLRLQALATKLNDPAATAEAKQAALQQMDAILVAMEAVRDKMLELESFNEAIELLREIIGAQDKLEAEIRAQQKNKLRDLLETEE